MQAAPTAGAAYFFYSLQICDQGFLGETNIFFVVIIAPDSAKSESEVGMKKVSLNLRLFGDGDAVDGGKAQQGVYKLLILHLRPL